jgi:hypothetical protein
LPAGISAPDDRDHGRTQIAAPTAAVYPSVRDKTVIRSHRAGGLASPDCFALPPDLTIAKINEYAAAVRLTVYLDDRRTAGLPEE